MLSASIMRRVLLIFAALYVSLSLTGGSIAHAMEPISCVDSATAASMGHSNGDGDQVPSDANKGFTHHHGGCHSHQVCDAVKSEVLPIAFGMDNPSPLFGFQYLPLATADPALRPPIA